MAFSLAIIPQGGRYKPAAERNSHSDGNGDARGSAMFAAEMNAGACLPQADLEGNCNA